MVQATRLPVSQQSALKAFLQDMDCIVRERDDARAAYALADRWIADLVRDARFAVGDRVTHAAFGPGRVLAVDSQKRAYEVAFDDLDTPRTISFKAKLEQA